MILLDSVLPLLAERDAKLLAMTIERICFIEGVKGRCFLGVFFSLSAHN
jgi:hypothetical protein